MRIGVGLSIPELATRGGRFSPASLFTGGVAGAWYDPSDTSTLFQDSAGTTPVTAVEQPVGLMLDKSQGLVLGSEAVISPLSVSGVGWSVVSNTTVATSTTATGTVFTTGTLATTKRYQVSFTASSLSGATCFVQMDSSVAALTKRIATAGNYTFILFGAGAANIQFQAYEGTAFSVTISNISIKELPGNHASQATAASRPILRARYNLLTYSEQFDNAAWSKVGATVTANSTTAPDGTSTADSISANITSYPSAFVTVTTVASTSYTLSIYAKSNTSSVLSMEFRGSGSTPDAVFNLSSGTVTSGTGAIVSVGNGWYRCSITKTSVDASEIVIIGIGFAPAVSDSIYIWGADLRTGSSAGTYQRIAAATDYATAGFAPYLAFDGVDDFLGAAYVQSAYPLTITTGANNDTTISGGYGIVSVPQSDSQYHVLRDMAASATDTNDRNGGSIDTPDIIVNGPKFALSQFETSLMTHQVNGGTETTAANTNLFGTSANIFVGKTRPAGLFSPAKDYGVVITNTVLTTDQKTSLKNWMAGKMGVTL